MFSTQARDLLLKLENGTGVNLNQIADLMRDGLVRLVSNNDDAGTQRVEITDAGRALIAS